MWIHTYHWLEANNLWKSAVSWCVGLALNSVWAVRLLLKKRKLDRMRHCEVMDKLDTSTPGGLGEIASLIHQGNEGGRQNEAHR